MHANPAEGCGWEPPPSSDLVSPRYLQDLRRREHVAEEPEEGVLVPEPTERALRH